MNLASLFETQAFWRGIFGFPKLKILQIYYLPEQRPQLLKGAMPYANPAAGPFLENSILRSRFNTREHLACDYFGVFSHRFFKKTGACFDFQTIRRLIGQDRGQADVYSFFPREKNTNVWVEAVNRWHPKLLAEIGQSILDRLGWMEDITQLSTPTIFSNHWLARPPVFAEYVRRLLGPAMDLMESDEQIKSLCLEDSGYGELFKEEAYRELVGHPGLSKEQCLAIFGRPYYTFHPFVCERLMSTWLALNPTIRFKQLDSQTERG